MRLGYVLADYRRQNDIRLVDLAKEIGVSKSVLHRIEAGENCAMTALVKVLVWLFAETI